MIIDPIELDFMEKQAVNEIKPKEELFEDENKETCLAQDQTMKVYEDIRQFEDFGLLTDPSAKRQRTSEFQDMSNFAVQMSSKNKKGSVISTEDRRPPNTKELEFYEEQAAILHNLIAYNMQHLAFFAQSEWLESFRKAISSLETSAEEPFAFFDDFLIEPSNESDPLLNIRFSNQQDTQRKDATVRLVTKQQQPLPYLSLPFTSIKDIVYPTLSQKLQKDISKLTQFQKSLARFKCREVLGFYKLMLCNPEASKLNSAQVMENSSRFVVRTILNWGREYFENHGMFNKSKIGKHKRVSLFSNEDFKKALIEFANEKGNEISVDIASSFIRSYHKEQALKGNSLPNPPSSRATVHRWLKLLNIKLGPRGKKRNRQ